MVASILSRMGAGFEQVESADLTMFKLGRYPPTTVRVVRHPSPRMGEEAPPTDLEGLLLTSAGETVVDLWEIDVTTDPRKTAAILARYAR